MTSVASAPLIVRLGHVRDATIRLLCFPQAGGGTATFQPLTSVLPAAIDLCALRMPGRETRRRESPLRRMEDVVGAVISALDSLEPLPLALLGYCSGSFAAYRVAHVLASAGRPPIRLIVLASPAPRLVAAHRWVHTLPNVDLIDYLRRTRITPEPILTNPDLFQIFESAIRADFEAYETWNYQPGPPLDVPITVFGARDDESVDFDDLVTWRGHTSKDLTLRIQSGGHDFFGAAAARLGHTLASELLTPTMSVRPMPVRAMPVRAMPA